MPAIRLIVYSDYLCPWCYLGTVRLRRIGEEFGERVHFEWRSFLLRPQPEPRRTLEKFRAYTQSWQRIAAEPDAPPFCVWQSDAGPPSHSTPPHLAAKAAATFGSDAFDRMHERLLAAYFTENRDITDTDTLRALWHEVGFPDDAFCRVADPTLLQATLAQHNEALERGISGVPAVHVAGREGAVIGAQTVETFRHWINRVLSLSV
jgi:predicted DsbA family dithiol-disulfide isomerase